MLGNFACIFVICDFFFKITPPPPPPPQIKNKINQNSGISPEYQTVWIQIRPDIILGLIWVQTGCNSNQQMTNIVTSRHRQRIFFLNLIVRAKTWGKFERQGTFADLWVINLSSNQISASYPIYRTTWACLKIRLRGYKTFFMLNSTKHEISTAHKNWNTDKWRSFLL